jgi:hypothetical protein
MMPALSVGQAVERYKLLTEFVKTLLKEGTDFGEIPGTNKPTLLKPGAEKLLTFFGLTKRFAIIEKVEDWGGAAHGEPFFYYLYRSALYYGDQLIAESDGSCNSFETKYRYRKAERTCPACGKAAIIKGKAEYGGGWLCFKKKDGCGEKFADGSPEIEGQQVGRVANPDIADQVNTLQKMAQKRALIAATLLAVNASEFFTQDMEDMPGVIEGEIVEAEAAPRPALARKVTLRGAQPTESNGKDSEQAAATDGTTRSILALLAFLKWDANTLANDIHARFNGLGVSDTDMALALEALSGVQKKALLQALDGEKAARTGGKK